MGGVLGVDAHFAGADVVEEGIVFELVGAFLGPYSFAAGRQAVDEQFAAVGEARATLDAMEVLADVTLALAADLAALTEQGKAVVVRK